MLNIIDSLHAHILSTFDLSPTSSPYSFLLSLFPVLPFLSSSLLLLFLSSSLSFSPPPSHPLSFPSFPAAISCPNLPSPSNGQVVLRGTTLSSTAVYSCNRGFILVGSNTRVCQVDGTWSGEAPSCTGERTPYLLLVTCSYIHVLST